MKALDRKLATIKEGGYTPDDFVIADAKDADMAFGVAAAGPTSTADAGGEDRPHYRTRQDYLAAMQELVAQGEVDIMLCSASNGEELSRRGVLDATEVTLAVRANDTTDIWNSRGSVYSRRASRPFRSARLEMVRPFCDLVLYSMTFNNDLDHDHTTLERYVSFREEARAVGMRHFLEVFNPNAPSDLEHDMLGAFVNDSIVRALAGVTSMERPLFLKMAYNGADALAELTGHDSGLVVGILGGSAGTTRDTFELLHQAEQHGARVALFGRKIQRAESQLDLVGLMRPVLRGELSPEAGVQAYHEALRSKGIAPARSLEADQRITEPVLRHG